ncbi:uncharacterized protein LOC111699270 [Eurytemora carolleeae]|uniref:uncharacterized protein LOC111699270 n=1 Tax=Eurytemora carolleeae TaxID=1294199 RepID=UPI000C78FEEB|nr:uncharacterized protein LOC111699270 [Eurytemora carolleeae]|eukprot:XP_023325665.1 uncharacterized protein LOC111699270 [Eurytemora affinis]
MEQNMALMFTIKGVESCEETPSLMWIPVLVCTGIYILCFIFLIILYIAVHIMAKQAARKEVTIVNFNPNDSTPNQFYRCQSINQSPGSISSTNCQSQGHAYHSQASLPASDLHQLYDEIPAEYLEQKPVNRRKVSTVFTVLKEEEENSTFNKEADALLKILTDPQKFGKSQEPGVDALMANMLRISGSIATQKIDKKSEKRRTMSEHYVKPGLEKYKRTISENVFSGRQSMVLWEENTYDYQTNNSIQLNSVIRKHSWRPDDNEDDDDDDRILLNIDKDDSYLASEG